MEGSSDLSSTIDNRLKSALLSKVPFLQNNQCGKKGEVLLLPPTLSVSHMSTCFPCSAAREREWPPCKEFCFGFTTNMLNMTNNSHNIPVILL